MGVGNIRIAGLLFLVFVLLAAGTVYGLLNSLLVFNTAQENYQINQGLMPPEERVEKPLFDNKTGIGSSPGQLYGLKRDVPVLMYHEIGSPRGKYKELYVEPDVFTSQLNWLRENGFSTVSLQEVYDHWKHGNKLPDNPVVITFDDGYRSMYETVLPLLKERDMRATFFIVAGYSDSPQSVSNDMIAAMSESGMEIGCHTYSHADLTITPENRLRHQLGDSKAALERIIDKPVNFLAYPAGRFDNNVAKNVEKYGYKGAVTTLYGLTSYDQNQYMWKRIRINNSDGLQGMINKLNK